MKFTDEEMQNILALLESTIISEEMPDYLEITENFGTIYILIAKKEYFGVPIHERIQKISALLEFDHDDILDVYPVIIEALDDKQLDELLAIYGKQ